MDSTRELLLNAAGETFAEKGFEGASVREICQKAGANIAAVNYHFGDKWKLYVEALKSAQCSHMDCGEFDVASLPLSPQEQLAAFIRGMLEQMLASDKPRWHMELMLRELARPTEACAEVVDAYIRPYAMQLWDIIGRLVPAETPDRLRWKLGFSVVGQILFYHMNRPIIQMLVGQEMYRDLSTTELAEHIARFSLAAFKDFGMLPGLSGHLASVAPAEPTS